MFNLPDGTHVILGVASRIEYPAEFSASREVRLEGEAYFDVVHDERHPFVVRAGELVATDLGTQFVVRAYRDDHQSQVVVREGSVSLGGVGLRARPVPAILRPGQLGRLTPAGEVVVQSADVAAQFAWTDGKLVFDRATLGDAVRQIQRWHEVTIRLDSPGLATRAFTTSFNRGESAAEMLQVIATVLHLDVVRTGRASYTLRAQ